MRVAEDELLLTYTEGEGEAKVFSQITVRGETVSIQRRGASESSMLLEIGKKQTSVYKVPPYSFDMTVRTKKIRNSLTEAGGELQLIYSMNVGGQEKSVRMKITAKP